MRSFIKRKHTWLQLTLLELLLGIVLFTLAPSRTALAYSGNGDLIVHVTVTGECYHKAGCSYLKSDREMPLEEAYLAGYRPCSRCNPPHLYGDCKTQFVREQHYKRNRRAKSPGLQQSGKQLYCQIIERGNLCHFRCRRNYCRRCCCQKG